jgi:DeoR/GlpR family transcriptional regulator of sugar metabolism
MLTRERKALILSVLQRDGRIVAKALSQDLGLSEDTIRRDLRELAGEGLLQRVHGGALPAAPAAAGLTARQALATDGKRAIGRAAAAMVQPGQVVFLDGGTTAVQVAKHLSLNLRATIVTHSPTVAVELIGHSLLEVQLIGGRLFQHSMVAVGAAASEQVGRVRADLYFMGVTGVHPEIGLTTGDAEEAAVKRTISRTAAETIVLASAEKLGAASPFVIVPLGEVTGIMVEADAPEETVQTYREAGVSVFRA